MGTANQEGVREQTHHGEKYVSLENHAHTHARTHPRPTSRVENRCASSQSPEREHVNVPTVVTSVSQNLYNRFVKIN